METANLEDLAAEAKKGSKSALEKFWAELKRVMLNLVSILGAGAALAAGAYLFCWTFSLGIPVTMV